MNAPALELVARAMLCNWLVCLAIWTSARMTNDTAKCIAIFWCVYAFIGSGFEHSVANMTLLSIALLAEHPPTVTLGGLGWNLLWVTIGNAISGAGIVGLGYWTASRPPAEADATPQPRKGEVLVKAETIGVSMPEVLVRKGVYAWMPPLPAIPGIELAGNDRRVGPGTTEPAVGQPARASKEAK